MNGPQDVDESGGNDSFTVVNNGFGLLEWSQDGGSTFSTQWGTDPSDTLQASAATTMTITLTADDSAIIDGISGSSSSSASAVQAKIHFHAATDNLNDTLLLDDSASTLGSGTYTFSGSSGIITGPLGDLDVSLGIPSFGGGVTLKGSNAGNTFDVNSSYSFDGIGEPQTVIGGTGDDTANLHASDAASPLTADMMGGSNIVNVGQGSVLSSLNGSTFVSDSGGTTTLNIDDSADTTSSSATLDNLSGNATYPYEVTGLSPGAITYGAGVTAVTISGGTSGANGVAFNINNTQAGDHDDDYRRCE